MDSEAIGQRLMQDLWALPQRGITKSIVSLRQGKITQWTFLCEANEKCFAMSHSTDSEQHAKDQVAGHECPAPPRRGIVPTGKSLLEKMWDELDDVIDAVKSWSSEKEIDGVNCFRDMDFPETIGYAKGIAECITFCAQPYFKIPEDVLRQSNRRWKMRQGIEPFSPTPSYRWNPPVEEKKILSPVTAKATTVKKRSPKLNTVTPKPVRNFTPDEVDMIKRNLHEGHMTADTLSEMFDVNVGRILAVAGTPEDDSTELLGAFILE